MSLVEASLLAGVVASCSSPARPSGRRSGPWACRRTWAAVVSIGAVQHRPVPPASPSRTRAVTLGQARVWVLLLRSSPPAKRTARSRRATTLDRSIVLEGAHAGHRRGTVDRARTCQARLAACTCLTASDPPLLTGSSAALARLSRYLGICYPWVPEGSLPRIDWETYRPFTTLKKSRADSGTTGSRSPAGSGRPAASPCRSSSAATWPGCPGGEPQVGSRADHWLADARPAARDCTSAGRDHNGGRGSPSAPSFGTKGPTVSSPTCCSEGVHCRMSRTRSRRPRATAPGRTRPRSRRAAWPSG